MPRIYALDPFTSLEEAQTDPGNYWFPEDYCNRCFPKAKREAGKHDDVDADHPPYSDTDYVCETCGKKLEDWNA